MTPALYAHFASALQRKDVTLKDSAFSLALVLLDLLEQDHGADQAKALINSVLTPLDPNTTFRTAGEFLHFISEGIVANDFVIKDKDDRGSAPVPR